MHNADCKGVSSLAFGSAIAMLLQKRSLGRTQGDRLKAINDFAHAWYSTRPGYHRLPPIRPSNLVNAQGWSDLCGSAIKAANTRAYVPLLRDFCRLHFTADTRTDRAVNAVLDSLVSYYETLYNGPMFLSAEAIRSLRATCARMGYNWLILREVGRDREKQWWHVTPKCNKFHHTPDYCDIMNPRYLQAYSEESLVGTIVKIWKLFVSGRYANSVQASVLMKRTLSMLLHYETDVEYPS